MKRKKRQLWDSNLSELRRLKLLHGFQVLQFSNIHLRIIGCQTVDYWPSNNTVWIVGSEQKGWKMSVYEVVDLVLSEAYDDLQPQFSEPELTGDELAHFRSIFQ